MRCLRFIRAASADPLRKLEDFAFGIVGIATHMGITGQQIASRWVLDTFNALKPQLDCID